MSFFLSLLTLVSVAIVHGQQGEKGTSIIPFPRVGRSGSNGLIPFPRVGRGGSEDMHEMKRQLIPFPRVGKRPYWHYDPLAASAYEYEDSLYGPMAMAMADGQGYGAPSSSVSESSGGDEVETVKRNNNNGSGMWFGPRLGKRKRRSVSVESSAEHDSSLDTSTLQKILHNFNWAIVPVKGKA